MNSIIVTAADEKFSDLVKGLVSSIIRIKSKDRPDLACLDLGLSRETQEWLSVRGVKLTVPTWDIPVLTSVREIRPQARALTARPFLRDYFPGYECYIWMDSDTWVQEYFALEWLQMAAANSQMALVPEVDRCYLPSRGVFEWKLRRMVAYYGKAGAEQLAWAPYYNAGVFALHADAPHWGPWAEYFRTGIETSESRELSDQTALNYMLWQTGLGVFPLPALCNWLCHLSLPSFNAKARRFEEPLSPKRPIGILHLTGDTKYGKFGYPDGNDEMVTSDFIFGN